MTILCGIDFSEHSSRVSEIAADMATRLRTSLTLVHAVSSLPREPEAPSLDGLLSVAEHAMEKRASALIGRGAKVFSRTAFGTPEHVFSEVGAERHARMMILSATGRGHSGLRPLGSIADRLSQHAMLPTLTMRTTRPFEAWMKGERPLRVVVGLDFGRSSREAWAWAQELAQIAAVELIGAHVYWPPEEFARLGLHGSRSFLEPDAEVGRILLRELEEHYPKRAGVTSDFRLQPGMGRPSDHLLGMAIASKADLIVVGSKLQGVLARLWEGSTSHQVLKHASCAVACVPLCHENRAEEERPISSVLVPTDFSELGNAAVPYAFSQVQKGGRVYLVHVADSKSWGSAKGDLFSCPEPLLKEQRLMEEQLRALIPVRAYLRDVRVESKVIHCRDAAEGIAQAAERFGVDLICLASHGRTGLRKAVLGSVAERVLEKTRRPVLLVSAPRG